MSSSVSQSAARYPTEPSEATRGGGLTDALAVAEALPATTTAPVATTTYRRERVPSAAHGRRESASVRLPRASGRQRAQSGSRTSASVPRINVAARDDATSSSDDDRGHETTMPPPRRNAGSSMPSSSPAPFGAMAPSEGCQITVNGIVCDLDAPRVIPDLLFGPHVLLLDGVTGRLLLPNGIDHSVRVVPGRSYKTVRLRGGAADVASAGTLDEDHRIVPRSWALETVSAHYRAGASDFYAQIPSMGQQIEAYVDEASPNGEVGEEQLERREGESDKKWKKRQEKHQRRAKKKDSSRREPIVASLPLAGEAIARHPRTVAERMHRRFVALRDAFNQVALSGTRPLPPAEGHASVATAAPTTVFTAPSQPARSAADDADVDIAGDAAARRWAVGVVGRSHRDLTGLAYFAREHPNLSIGAAIAAYRRLPPEEKSGYIDLAEAVNEAAHDMDLAAAATAIGTGTQNAEQDLRTQQKPRRARARQSTNDSQGEGSSAPSARSSTQRAAMSPQRSSPRAAAVDERQQSEQTETAGGRKGTRARRSRSAAGVPEATAPARAAPTSETRETRSSSAPRRRAQAQARRAAAEQMQRLQAAPATAAAGGSGFGALAASTAHLNATAASQSSMLALGSQLSQPTGPAGGASMGDDDFAW